MKKLIAIILAGVVSLSAQEIPKQFGIPKRFDNYRSGIQFSPRNFYMGERLFHERRFDMDGDGIADVSELYPLIETKHLITKYPLFYGFDINQNGIYDEEEILMDKQMDGLNGNETKIVENKTL